MATCGICGRVVGASLPPGPVVICDGCYEKELFDVLYRQYVGNRGWGDE